jgi:hypothetical protein
VKVVYRRIADELETFLGAGDGPYHLVSPFITVPLLKTLIERYPVQAVYTSWRSDHLLTGHSSLDVYPLLQSHGVSLITCDRLHAKVFTNRDFSRALVGSANLTHRGLGLAPLSNLEAAVLLEDDSNDIRAFLSSAMVAGVLVDQAIYDAYRVWLEQNADIRASPPSTPGPALPSNPDGPWLLALLPASPSPRALWEAVNLDRASDPTTVHDLMLLGGDLLGARREVNQRMRRALASNAFFQHILEQIRRSERGIHFGGMKEIVQSRCANVPAPHRRDLTEVIQNQYRWIVELYPEMFEVVRPRWSEVIRVRMN